MSVAKRGSGSETRTVYISRLLCMYMKVHSLAGYDLAFRGDARGFIELQESAHQVRRLGSKPLRHRLFFLEDTAADRCGRRVAAGFRSGHQDRVGGNLHLFESVAGEGAFDHFVIDKEA